MRENLCLLATLFPPSILLWPVLAPAWRGDLPLLKQLLAAGARLDVEGVSRGVGPYGPLEWAERKVRPLRFCAGARPRTSAANLGFTHRLHQFVRDTLSSSSRLPARSENNRGINQGIHDSVSHETKATTRAACLCPARSSCYPVQRRRLFLPADDRMPFCIKGR